MKSKVERTLFEQVLDQNIALRNALEDAIGWIECEKQAGGLQVDPKHLLKRLKTALKKATR